MLTSFRRNVEADGRRQMVGGRQPTIIDILMQLYGTVNILCQNYLWAQEIVSVRGGEEDELSAV